MLKVEYDIISTTVKYYIWEVMKMTFDSNKPIEDVVSSKIEFGIGSILKWILFIILIGATILVVAGSTETSSEALLILLVLGVGFVLGIIGLAFITLTGSIEKDE